MQEKKIRYDVAKKKDASKEYEKVDSYLLKVFFRLTKVRRKKIQKFFISLFSILAILCSSPWWLWSR